jgi:hypothetical protein
MLDTTTKQDGTFELLGCAERPYQVDVRGVGGSQGSPFAEPMATQSFQDVMPGGAELVVHISHAQPASAFVEGVVVDARGDPIADAAVFPFPRIQTGGHGIAAQTDEKGRFRAGPLAPGLYDVTVRAEGRVPFATTPFELHADEHRDLGTLHLARGGTLRAKLAGSGALDGVDVHVTARDRSARESCRIEGNVATATLAPGTWDLRTSGGGCAPAAASFEVREGEETAIEVTLTRANEVALVLVGLDALAAKQPRSTPYLLGRILDESGVALAERGLPAMADQRTEWRIALKPGAYRFEVVDGPGALASARFTVPDRATTEDLAIELR